MEVYRKCMRKCRTETDRRFLEKWKKLSTDIQYLDLFDIEEDRIRGEISPAYCMMDTKEVDRFYDVVGKDTKIIYLMRDPIERDWSFAKRSLHRRTQNFDVRDVADYQNYLLKPGIRRRANYSETLRLWQSRFEENLFVGFYENLLADPRGHLESICAFLGVEFQRSWFKETLGGRPGSTADTVTMPEGLLPFLAEINLPMLKELNQMIPNSHPQRWLERARTIHGATDSSLGD